jgi:aspartate kinase
MSLIVQKYGGTSVGTPEKIKGVARQIAEYYKQGYDLVVVVSAMDQTTDELIELARKISANPPHREMDMLLTVGERISMALLSIALAELQVPAISFTGSQSGIITDSSHRRARIKKIAAHRAKESIQQKKVTIIAGFQGVSEEKEVTTLGRGGSDTTAVALAASFKAKMCEIYTDVDGVFTADPRIVENPKFCESVSLQWMAEMATHGAKVLHPRSVSLALQYDVSVCVKKFEIKNKSENINININKNERSGSMIQKAEKGMEEHSIIGVTSDADKMAIQVELTRPTVANSIWGKAAESKLSILAPMFTESKLWFFVEREFEGEWKKHLNDLQSQGFIKTYEFKPDIVPLSVIGHRFMEDGTALFQVLEKMSENHISVLYGTGTGLVITVGVPVQKVKEGVKILHQEFVKV